MYSPVVEILSLMVFRLWDIQEKDRLQVRTLTEPADREL